MPSLQVRAVPEAIYQKLIQRAEVEHRSFAQQTISILARGLGMGETWVERRRSLLDRIGRRTQQQDPQGFPDVTEMVRADRNR